MGRPRTGGGRSVYVPKITIDVVKNIANEKNISKAEAFKEMAQYCRVGMEAEKVLNFIIPNKRR